MSVSDRPILGIETSCDETAAAVVVDGRICSNAIFSQTEHSLYGGVVPELASRNHVRKLLPVVQHALSESGADFGDLGGIAVTRGPGLVGCLLVGISVAKGLALGAGLPLVGVHHIEGHLFAGAMAHTDLKPPFMALVASGGHTELIYVCDWGNYERWGRTRDDAAGEAFDKVAKILGLLREGEVTMGGPRISALAEEGDEKAFDFPRGLMNDPGFDFSFSGLKTSVLYRIRDKAEEELEADRADIAASFQAAVVDVLIDKTLRAAKAAGVEQILLSGGVAANRALRAGLERGGQNQGMAVFYPPTSLCTDNAAMIAGIGELRLRRGEKSGSDLNAVPRLPLPGLRERQG
ncbi:MAG: tRNA (adenosine(37)-N6)-threonylcarbamoyltransferase complex transferase subunit TsaD [Candidatus Latescibacteria bacterium]|nr:tRNA (adenosine(37)-N6)-threonylcarbamoyltransferase complex transferase subunit TsaD [Candidatus Latescibacterota bacterium]